MAYDFFQNKACEYFPCHENADPETFSCIFCYCPLYALGENCGGNFIYTKTGVKDCSNCLRPHKRECYGAITEKLGEVIKMVQEEKKNDHKTIFYDTNMVNPDGSYFIPELTIRRNKLVAGDIVTAYQDNERWTGEVVLRNGKWGIVLRSDAEQLSAKHHQGQLEGFREGKLLEELIIMRILERLNIPDETAKTIREELDRIHT